MIKICLVDDHEMFRKGLEEILKQNENFMLTGSFTGLDELIQSGMIEHPDIVLLDLSLNGEMSMDSIPVIQETFAGCRVIVLTMHNKPLLIRSVLKKGARAYVVKDSPPKVLIQAVQRVYDGGYYFDPELSDAMADLLKEERGNENIRYYELTAREQEVFLHLAEGMTSAQVGRIMFISKKTAENYRFRILKKLELSSVMELNEYARELGLL